MEAVHHLAFSPTRNLMTVCAPRSAAVCRCQSNLCCYALLCVHRWSGTAKITGSLARKLVCDDVSHTVTLSGDHDSVSSYTDGTPDGFKKKSSVLNCEAVSYVSSAYIPACLRQGGRPTLSNAHRASECAESAGNIRDDLDEVITLNSVSIVVAEYIPFGNNQMLELNHGLGTTERVQGGFFTAAIQDDWSGG